MGLISLIDAVEPEDHSIYRYLKSTISGVRKYSFSDYRGHTIAHQLLTVAPKTSLYPPIFETIWPVHGMSSLLRATVLDLLVHKHENELDFETAKRTPIMTAGNTEFPKKALIDKRLKEVMDNGSIEDLVQVIESLIYVDDFQSVGTNPIVLSIDGLEADYKFSDTDTSTCKPLNIIRGEFREKYEETSPIQKESPDNKTDSDSLISTHRESPASSFASTISSPINPSSTKDTSNHTPSPFLHPNSKEVKFLVSNKVRKLFKGDKIRKYEPPPIVEPRTITMQDIECLPYVYERQILSQAYEVQESRCKSQRFYYHYYWYGRLQEESEARDLKAGVTKVQRFRADFVLYLENIYQGQQYSEQKEFEGIDFLEEPPTKAEISVLDNNIEYYKKKVYGGTDIQEILRDDERLIQRSPKFFRYYHTLEFKNYQMWIAYKESETRYYNSVALISKELTHSPTHFEYLY